MATAANLKQEVLDAIKLLGSLDPATDDLSAYLYIADSRMEALLSEVEKLSSKGTLNKKEQAEAGKLMEKVAVLAFRGIEGRKTFKSFQSPGPQHDLIVVGDDQLWLKVCQLLYLDTTHRGILVEAKFTKRKVGDKELARLCAIMDINLPHIGLGIFFTLRGASGFPTNLKKQRALRDSRLRQVLYHAKTGKPVLIFDKSDIKSLKENGSFLRLLIRKIRDVSELTGLPTTPSNRGTEELLPRYLEELL